MTAKNKIIIEWSTQTLDNVLEQEVSQREMMKIIDLFRKNEFRGENTTRRSLEAYMAKVSSMVKVVRTSTWLL